MREVVVVMRAGRQQRDARVAAPAQHGEARLHALEERREPHRVALLEEIAGDVGVHHAVGERVADAGRRLGVIVDDAPGAARIARDVDGVELQVAGRRGNALAGAQVGGIGEDERRGERSPRA